MDFDEGTESPSYRKVATREANKYSSVQPPFDLPPYLREQIYHDELRKNKGMDMEANPSHTKVACSWILGKCILQDPTTLGYVISIVKVGIETQYMQYHTIIGKFLGL
jgi:hypothetical protein